MAIDLTPDVWRIPEGTSTSSSSSNTSVVPAWVSRPPDDLRELEESYGNVGASFDPSNYLKESGRMQGHIVSTAMNSANSAAAEYANRSRQAGGSGAGAGLIKAQGAVKGMMGAGEMRLEAEKFAAGQRKEAAGLAAEIARSLGTLRSEYLKSMITQAGMQADSRDRNRALDLQEDQMMDERMKTPTIGKYGVGKFGEVTGVAGTPFRDSMGRPTSDATYAPTNRGWYNKFGAYG